MNTNTNIHPHLRAGIIFSTIFHGLLLLLFVLTHIEIAPMLLPVAEVSFISGRPGLQTRKESGEDKPQGAPAAVSRDVIATESPSKPPAPKVTSQKPQPAKKEASTPVTPPKRPMLEQEEPKVPASTAPKKELEDSDNKAPQRLQTEAPVEPSTVDQNGRGARTSATGRTGESGQADGSGGQSGQPFTIEGEAAQRVIVQQVIPVYPEGLQREAVIKFRFSVQPDGRITDIIPMRKGDAVLERITIEALSKWRFNPLPGGVEQKTVQGVITFRYELR